METAMKEITYIDQTKPASTMHERIRVQTINDEPTMTQQQFKDEADINSIMRKYGADPVAFNALTRQGGVYADFSHLKDYHGMLQDVADAQDAFASLPAQIRSRFANDPGSLISFLQDEKNHTEGVSLGLFQPRETPAPAAPTPAPAAPKKKLDDNP